MFYILLAFYNFFTFSCHIFAWMRHILLKLENEKEECTMNLKTIGPRIKEARENSRITQEKLAAAIGCTTQHISAIERGVKTPRLDTFIAIANVLNVSSDVLLQDVLEQTVDPLASEFTSAVAPLSMETRRRVLKAIRVFSQEE